MAVQIQVQDETWERLLSRKNRPSQTFDDIISDALSFQDEQNG